MSDEQKRIEELENQLKIAKLEKEIAELKADNSQIQEKFVSKKKQKEDDKKQEKELQEQEDYMDFAKCIGLIGNSPEQIQNNLKRKIDSGKKISIAEYSQFNINEQFKYLGRVNWLTLPLYLLGCVSYGLRMLKKHPFKAVGALILVWLISLTWQGDDLSTTTNVQKELKSSEVTQLSAEDKCKKALGKEKLSDEDIIICSEDLGIYVYRDENNSKNDYSSCQLGDLIGDDVKTISYNNMSIDYHSEDFSETQVKKLASECNKEGVKNQSEMNCCINLKMYP